MIDSSDMKVELSPIFQKEEFIAELKFAKIAFFTHFLIYSLYFFFDYKLNLGLLFGTILFTFLRILSLNQIQIFKLRLANIFGSIVEVYTVCNFFLHDHFFSVTGNHLLDIFFLNVILNFVILHESNRIYKFSSILVGIFCIIFFYSYEIYFLQITQNEASFIFLSLPFFVFLFTIGYGFYLNQAKRKIIYYYTDLLREKMIINKDITLARNVQESLFPKIDKLNGISFEVFRKTTNLIGGDFYDFVQLREGDIGIFITDVAGHGYSSAMVAAMIKVLVSSIPYRFKLEPSSLLNYLDEKISGEYKSHHASASYMYINFKTHSMIYANAGHPFLIYSKNGKEFREIENTGTLVGFGLRKNLQQDMEIKFQSGDRFFLYTDGLIENSNSKKTFLESNDLLKFLNENKNLPLSELSEKLLKSVMNHFENKDFTDDSMFLLFEFE